VEGKFKLALRGRPIMRSDDSIYESDGDPTLLVTSTISRKIEHLNPRRPDLCLSMSPSQTFCLLISLARYTEARIDSARIVIVGFCQPALTKLAPSTTNRFLWSWL